MQSIWACPMIVNCSLDHDYILEPEYGDLAQFMTLFSDTVKRVADGWTLKIYDEVPEFTIRGVYYFGAIAKETRSFETKTQTLKSLGLGVSISNPRILRVDRGIYSPEFKKQVADKLGYKSTGIPQLHAVQPNSSDDERVIIGCTGHYNFNTGIFNGQLDFDSLNNIWNE